MRTLLPILVLCVIPVPSYAAGDPVQGKRDFTPCAACHSVEPGTKNKPGPNLHGVIGRTAGSAPDFSYSQAMRKAGFVWDEEKLRQYIANPKGTVPGDKMAFAGVPNAAKIENIIAYLEQLSH